MTLQTFNPSIDPSPGTSFKPIISLNEAEFGDGYTQSSPKGLNHIRDTITLQWDGVDMATAISITDFFKSQGGFKTFYYQPVGYTATQKWTCKEWSMSASAPWKVTAKLEQSFYTGT
jgi:phage-related protein